MLMTLFVSKASSASSASSSSSSARQLRRRGLAKSGEISLSFPRLRPPLPQAHGGELLFVRARVQVGLRRRGVDGGGGQGPLLRNFSQLLSM